MQTTKTDSKIENPTRPITKLPMKQRPGPKYFTNEFLPSD